MALDVFVAVGLSFTRLLYSPTGTTAESVRVRGSLSWHCFFTTRGITAWSPVVSPAGRGSVAKQSTHEAQSCIRRRRKKIPT